MFINVCQLRNEFMRACVKKEYKYYLFSLFTFAKIPDNNINGRICENLVVQCALSSQT